MKNEPNFTPQAPTKHAIPPKFTPQLVSTFPQKMQRNAKKYELFATFTNFSTSFSQPFACFVLPIPPKPPIFTSVKLDMLFRRIRKNEKQTQFPILRHANYIELCLFAPVSFSIIYPPKATFCHGLQFFETNTLNCIYNKDLQTYSHPPIHSFTHQPNNAKQTQFKQRATNNAKRTQFE
jgi:hypothetical protein